MAPKETEVGEAATVALAAAAASSRPAPIHRASRTSPKSEAVTAIEGGTNAAFVVERANGSEGAASVGFGTGAGTATPGLDYGRFEGWCRAGDLVKFAKHEPTARPPRGAVIWPIAMPLE